MKKLLFIFMMIAIGFSSFAQTPIDTITDVNYNASGGTRRLARKLHEVIRAVNTNVDSLTDIRSDLDGINTTFAPLANPTFSGVQKVGSDTLSTKAYARSVGGGSGDLAFADTVNNTGFLETQFRVDTAKQAIREEIDAISTGTGFLATSDTATMLAPYATTGEVNNAIKDSIDELLASGEAGIALSDTIPLFVFGGGADNAGDTTSFTTSSIYGRFFNKGNDTLNITELRTSLSHGIGLDTCSVQIHWHATFKSGSATVLNTTAQPIGRVTGTNLALTTGNVDASFNNAKIPPNVWVWCTTPTIVTGRKPTSLIVQLSGFKTR